MGTRRKPDGHVATNSSGEERKTPRLSRTSERSPIFRSITGHIKATPPRRRNRWQGGVRRVWAVNAGSARAERPGSDRAFEEGVADGLVDVAVHGGVVDREGGFAPPARPAMLEAARRLAFAFAEPGSEWEAWHEGRQVSVSVVGPSTDARPI